MTQCYDARDDRKKMTITVGVIMYLNRREWKRLKGCVFSPPSDCPVLARGREARKRNPSITSIPNPVYTDFIS